MRYYSIGGACTNNANGVPAAILWNPVSPGLTTMWVVQVKFQKAAAGAIQRTVGVMRCTAAGSGQVVATFANCLDYGASLAPLSSAAIALTPTATGLDRTAVFDTNYEPLAIGMGEIWTFPGHGLMLRPGQGLAIAPVSATVAVGSGSASFLWRE